MIGALVLGVDADVEAGAGRGTVIALEAVADEVVGVAVMICGIGVAVATTAVGIVVAVFVGMRVWVALDNGVGAVVDDVILPTTTTEGAIVTVICKRVMGVLGVA
jgi:hypothetical protein